jgi:hypothetical protein
MLACQVRGFRFPFQHLRNRNKRSAGALKNASSNLYNASFRTVTLASTQRRTPGLLLRGSVWHIDNVIYGKRICQSTGTRDRIEAEALLARRVIQARRVHLFGEQRDHSFREAAARADRPPRAGPHPARTDAASYNLHEVPIPTQRVIVSQQNHRFNPCLRH